MSRTVTWFLCVLCLVACQRDGSRASTSSAEGSAPQEQPVQQDEEDVAARPQLKHLNPVVLMTELEKARVKTARVELQTLKNAMDLYRVQHGRTPVTLDALAAERLIERVPVDPWGESYQLVWDGAAGVLGSGGPDKRWGNEDDVRLELRH